MNGCGGKHSLNADNDPKLPCLIANRQGGRYEDALNIFGQLIVVSGVTGFPSGSALYELAEVRFGKFGDLICKLFHRLSPYPCVKVPLSLKMNFLFSASPRR